MESLIPVDDITESMYEVLQAAVFMATNDCIQRLATLRARLHDMFPGRQDDVTGALQYWANHVGATHNRSEF